MSNLYRTRMLLLRAGCAGMLLAYASIASAADTTAPDSRITQPSPSATLASPVVINGTATDDVAVNFVWLTIRDLGTGSYWQNGAWSAAYQHQRVPVSPAGGKVTNWSYQFQEGTNRGSGAYRVSIGAVDAAGNLDATKANIDFVVGAGASVDGVTPQTTITTPVQAANLHSPVGAAGTATDNVGVDFVWITVRDLGTLSWWTGTGWTAAYVRVHVPVAAAGATSTAWSYDFDPSGSGGSGTYQLFAKAQDMSANVDPSAAQVWFNATDNGGSADLPPVADAGPDLAIVDVDASGDEPVTLSAARSRDPDGVITAVDWSENGVPLASGTEVTLTLSAGPHVVDVKVTDDDGNTDAASVAVGVYDRFVDQLLVSGLQEPVSLDWLPDGRALVLERAGGVKLLDMSATPPSVTDYFTIPDVETVGETGALDVLVPADFATSSQFYVFYIKHTTKRVRVARFNFTGSAADLDSETAIWQSPNVVVNEQHVGGGLAFDKNGYLYVSLGDNWDPSSSQNLSTVWGSVLRLNRNGSVPADNPFNDGAGPNADAIFAYGLRNPFRLYLEADGDVRIGDVGGNDQNTAVEEFNHLRRGANYGWPNCEGPCGQLTNVTEPWYSYPHAGTSASVIDGFDYHGTQFPALFKNVVFFGDFARQQLRYLVVDSQDSVAANLPFLPQAGRLVWVGDGPDGSVYRLTITGELFRTRYQSGNLFPIIGAATANPSSGPPPLNVRFSGSATDPNGDALTYRWRFDDQTSLNGATVNRIFTTAGRRESRLEVSDGTDTVFSSPLTIEVGGKPTVSIDAPTDGSLFRAGDQIVATASGADPDETLGDSNFVWTVHFTHNGHEHPVIPATPGRSISFDVPTSGHDFTDDTGYVLDVTVTDGTGLSRTDSVTIRPDKVNVTFRSNVAGVKVSVDSVPHAVPYVMDDVIGFVHTISAPSTACIGNVKYTFANWSGGQPATHQLIVPASAITNTATYTAGPKCDVSAPDTTIDYPATYATVTAPVTISGTVVDDLAAHHVRLRIMDRTTNLWWDGAAWTSVAGAFNVPVASATPTATWSYVFNVYAVTNSRSFYIDAKGVDGFGNLDLSPDGETFDVR